MTPTGPFQTQPFCVQLYSPPYPPYPFPVKHFPAQPTQVSSKQSPGPGHSWQAPGGFCSHLVFAQRGPEKPRTQV